MGWRLQSVRSACRLESGTQIRKPLWGDGNADINSLDRGCRRFFGVNGGMEFGGYPAQDIKLDSDLVSVLSVNALLQVETLLDEEMSLGFARFTPALSEAVLVISTPGIELTERGSFRVIAKELD